jgi:hypothetical protein
MKVHSAEYAGWLRKGVWAYRSREMNYLASPSLHAMVINVMLCMYGHHLQTRHLHELARKLSKNYAFSKQLFYDLVITIKRILCHCTIYKK